MGYGAAASAHPPCQQIGAGMVNPDAATRAEGHGHPPSSAHARGDGDAGVPAVPGRPSSASSPWQQGSAQPGSTCSALGSGAGCWCRSSTHGQADLNQTTRFIPAQHAARPRASRWDSLRPAEQEIGHWTLGRLRRRFAATCVPSACRCAPREVWRRRRWPWRSWWMVSAVGCAASVMRRCRSGLMPQRGTWRRWFGSSGRPWTR